MTIQEAIEILEEESIVAGKYSFQEYFIALKLGVEALKWVSADSHFQERVREKWEGKKGQQWKLEIKKD